MIRAFLAAALALTFATSAMARGPATVQVPITLVPAYYVSTTGNDSNSGTDAAHPFATLQAAQFFMQTTGVKITYLRGGTYSPPAQTGCAGVAGDPCALSIHAADNGTTYTYYPPDGVDSPILDGGSTGMGNGLNVMVAFGGDSSDGVTINGLTMKNFQYSAIASTGGTSNMTITNNVISNGFDHGLSNNGAVMCYGCVTSTVSHNYIHDIAGFGISLSNCCGGEITGLVMANNFLEHICTVDADCGALYLDMADDSSATSISITNNYVRDGNVAATLGGGFGAAVYMDDCASNVTMTGNVVTGRNGANTVMMHGGNNLHFNNNFIDLSTNAQHYLAYQTSSDSGCSAGTMSGNQFRNNIFVSGGGGGGTNLLSGSPTNGPSISNNNYWNYAGSAISSGGSYSDSNPVTQNPSLSGWTYALASGSLAYTSPVSYPTQPANWGFAGFWGPPGFVVTTSGSAPSQPH